MLAALTRISPFWDYLTFTLTTPLGIPAMLLLVDQWHYSKRAIKRLAWVLWVLFAVYLTGVYHILGVTDFSKRLIGASAPVICFTLFIICTKYRDGRLVFTIATALFLAGMTEAFATMMAPRSAPLWIIVKVLLPVLQNLLIWRVARPRFHRMLNTAHAAWLRLSVLPVGMVVCLGTGYLNPVINGGDRPAFPTVALCMLSILVYMALYMLLETMEAQNVVSRDNYLLSSQMDYMEQRTEDLLRGRQSLMTYRHDMRHYIGMIKGQVAAGDPAGIEAVLGSMERELENLSAQYVLRSYTGIVTIDAVLSRGADRARTNGITYTVELDMPNSLPVDMTKLSVVLANAVENACNACCQMDLQAERCIRITGGLRRAQFYLTVANTYAGTVEFDRESGLPLTRRINHGYGSQSIAAFAREYGAELSYSARDGWFYIGLLIAAGTKAPV